MPPALAPSALPALRLLVALLALGAGTRVLAQCSTSWRPGDGVPGVLGTVYATHTWDPDGAGPAAPQLVVGGYFTLAGDAPAKHIALFDPATGTWSALGAGLGNTVRSLATLPNGDLVAGGDFQASGPTQTRRLARWDGSAWSEFGGNCDGPVSALAVLPNGDLVAGGSFTQIGGTAAARIARWDGVAWSPLGAGMDNLVLALLLLPGGDLVAGGYFQAAGGAPAARLARWDGSSWHPLGAGVSGGAGVHTLCLAPNGDVLAGGTFTTAGGAAASRIARWDGTTWSPLGGGLTGEVFALATLANGTILVGGAFAGATGGPTSRLLAWDGAGWSVLGDSIDSGVVHTLRPLPDGTLFAAGHFFQVGALVVDRIARWDGTAWSALARGFNGQVHAQLPLPNGDLVVAGDFTTAPGVPARRIARWDGTTWHPLGSGCDNSVRALALLPNGDVVAGGLFATAGGVATGRVARWNGTTWSPLGSGLGTSPTQAVSALLVLPSGDLLAGGTGFVLPGPTSGCVARWNGTSWLAIDSALTASPAPSVRALAALPDGSVVAGGYFFFQGPAGNNLARWNGSTWSPLGAGLPAGAGVSVNALAVASGDLIVTTQAPAVARWDGASWSLLGQVSTSMSSPTSLCVLPDGDLLIGGTGWYPTMMLVQRWDGSSWLPFATGLGGEFLGSQPRVNSLVLTATGDLAVGGHFTQTGTGASAYLARLATTCPAAATPAGSGCGTSQLAADLPWTGATWRSRATGLPAAAFVFVVNGFQPANLPLPLVFATALPGCTLHVQPDYVDLQLAVAGRVEVAFAVPETPALVGAAFHHQMVPMALDSTLAVTATDAVRLAIGTW